VRTDSIDGVERLLCVAYEHAFTCDLEAAHLAVGDLADWSESVGFRGSVQEPLCFSVERLFGGTLTEPAEKKQA
jgi:hypothetical protein